MILDWYFDFISPFAYLQWARLGELPAGAEVRLQPVLLAGILNHWGQLGPAEIGAEAALHLPACRPGSRREPGCPSRCPPATLQFAAAAATRLGARPDARGRRPACSATCGWRGAFRSSPDPGPRCSRAWAGRRPGRATVKEQLRAATDAAIARGVFGVPTAALDGHLFWGYDATDMLLDYCRDPRLLDTARCAARPACRSAAARAPQPS